MKRNKKKRKKLTGPNDGLLFRPIPAHFHAFIIPGRRDPNLNFKKHIS